MPYFHIASSNVLENFLLAQIPQEQSSTACEMLYSPNPWIVFPWIQDIKLSTKLFCHLAMHTYVYIHNLVNFLIYIGYFHIIISHNIILMVIQYKTT